MCYICKGKRGIPADGNNRCASCIERQRGYNRARRAKIRENIKNGIKTNCWSCHKLVNNQRLCDECEQKKSQNAHRRHIQQKTLVMQEYGGACACCGESELAFLAIDHIDNTGYLHRKETKKLYTWLIARNFPKDNFQILCMNCNWAKYTGVCPHQK